jgi:bacterioferritin (cytochrome b1)
MQSNTQSEFNQSDVDQLNSFLRGELAAVETYDQALNKIQDRQIQQPLREVRASHDRRAYLLRQRILVLGGEPAASSGLWGGIAKMVEAGAAAFGVSPAIAALEEGEDRGRDDYRSELSDLSPETQSFVSENVLPEQLRTHEVVSSLKRELKARSASS